MIEQLLNILEVIDVEDAKDHNTLVLKGLYKIPKLTEFKVIRSFVAKRHLINK